MSPRPIMIMAGGTGGHVFPGLAVAAELKARHCDVVWLGTHRGLEARLVPQHGIEVEWITIVGVRGRGIAAWLAAPFRIVRAMLEALRAFKRRQPVAVLGLGGFVSGPGGLAAWLSRRPLLIHEQNSVAGTTNRWLAPLATRVFEAFPNSFPGRTGVELVGNPVRRALCAIEAPRMRFGPRREARRRLLIIGGSQGARILNETVPRALAELATAVRPEVWHQAGRLDVADTRTRYADLGIDARVEEFIDDVAGAYQWTDLVVCRAGALTVAELEAVGVGAILVPFKAAIDDHQTRNAEHFARRGAGVVIPQDELTPTGLASELRRSLGDFDRLMSMAETARSQAQVNAAERLAIACIAVAGGRT